MRRMQTSTESVIRAFLIVQVLSILGFVEDLIVEDDPEFEFEDRFRSSQKSNEKRQKQLYNLSFCLFFSLMVECSCDATSASRRRSEVRMPCLGTNSFSTWREIRASWAERTERRACNGQREE